MSQTIDVLTRMYAAYAAMDVTAIDALIADGCVMHISGHHPLSGDKVGKAAIWEYLGAVAALSAGQGGYEVHSFTSDDAGHGVALLTGTIRDHVRPVIHVLHVSNGQITEFWDAYLDAEAEDAFWRGACAQG